MHEKLRIHHAVGSRVFFDSDREGVEFHVGEDEGAWRFTVQSPRTSAIEQVLEFKDELNVFIFREENGQSAEKIWFYAGRGDVTYDDDSRELCIVTHGRIAYNPAEF